MTTGTTTPARHATTTGLLALVGVIAGGRGEGGGRVVLVVGRRPRHLPGGVGAGGGADRAAGADTGVADLGSERLQDRSGRVVEDEAEGVADAGADRADPVPHRRR